MLEKTKKSTAHKKALFYISGKNVQHIGLRLIITTEMIHRGFEKGGAFNLPDGRVEVVLEGEKDDIINFHKDIQENLIRILESKAEDKEELMRKIGNPGIKVEELDFRPDLLVLDIGLFSHSLTFDQVYKGVDVFKELTEANRELTTALKELNKRLNKKKS